MNSHQRRMRKVGTMLAALVIGAGVLLSIVTVTTARPAAAAAGDFLKTTTFSTPCSSGLGVGVTFDGAHLWYSCYNQSGADLYRADPVTGVVDYSASIDNGLGALAYDAADNVIWAGQGCGTDPNSLWKIQLGASHQVASFTAVSNPRTDNCLMDGVAYDATDGTLYLSPAGSTTITQATEAGVPLRPFP